MILISCAIIFLIFVGINLADRVGGDVSRRANFKTLLQYEGKIGFKDNDKVKKGVKYYYLKKFKENEKDILFSWNWSAALVPFWALYRKMYIIWFVFFIIFS